jgi:hypothetical protein
VGLKENIIIGKLIPAGTGMERYRYFDIDAPDYVPMEYFSSDEADPAAYLAGLQGNFVADDNAVFQDLAEEDEVLETLVTVPEQELAVEPEVVTPEAQMPEVETVSVDEVTSEEEPPETSAL